MRKHTTMNWCFLSYVGAVSSEDLMLPPRWTCDSRGGGGLPGSGPSPPQLLACALGSGEEVLRVVAVCLHLLDW